ncbi:unnamed protein product [Allacma fusca]|uniref:Uncharacterized protein n=1 Tax=Allacma fusca TaxID=39272 RepID=A0A8J2LKB7_9HEXA|nr:unnamed protein product [Allacma fusca]
MRGGKARFYLEMDKNALLVPAVVCVSVTRELLVSKQLSLCLGSEAVANAVERSSMITHNFQLPLVKNETSRGVAKNSTRVNSHKICFPLSTPTSAYKSMGFGNSHRENVANGSI